MMYPRIIVIAVTLWNLIQGSIAQVIPYAPPQLEKEGGWSMVLLPDPQNYHRFERNSPIFDLMMAWIKENHKPLNIKMVLCVGDLIIDNEKINPDGIESNMTSRQQWQAVATSFGRLDGHIPYITALGNHDYGFSGVDNKRASNFSNYFPEDKNQKTQELLKEVGPNAQGMPCVDNAAYEFISPNDKKYLVLSLEFAPRNAAINWAKEVISQPKYRNHSVILLTHSYLNNKNEHIAHENYPLTDANYGKDIWEKLVKPSSNIQMVFSGHIAGNNFRSSVGFRTDTLEHGKIIQQMMFNAQALGGGNRGNGGDGWLRILEFSPDESEVKVRTFSPFFAISPTTIEFAWRRESFDEFTFKLNH